MINSENMEPVKEVVLSDKWKTFQEISAKLKIPVGSYQRYSYNDLNILCIFNNLLVLGEEHNAKASKDLSNSSDLSPTKRFLFLLIKYFL